MPVAFRSNAWLPESASKLKPKLFSASSASGGVRKPLPSWTVSPLSATADSRLVKMTSPFSNPWITRTAVGAVARLSERIIDCPVRVIVIAFAVAFDWARTATPIAHRIASRSARHAVLANRPVFNMVAIWGVISFRVTQTELHYRRVLVITSGIAREDQPSLMVGLWECARRRKPGSETSLFGSQLVLAV